MKHKPRIGTVTPSEDTASNPPEAGPPGQRQAQEKQEAWLSPTPSKPMKQVGLNRGKGQITGSKVWSTGPL